MAGCVRRSSRYSERINHPSSSSVRPRLVVQREQLNLGLRRVDSRDVGAQVRQPSARAARTRLKPFVRILESASCREGTERIELAVPRERAAHRFEGRGVAQPKGREAVAELGEVDVTLVLAVRLHAVDCTTRGAAEAMVMRDARPEYGRLRRRIMHLAAEAGA